MSDFDIRINAAILTAIRAARESGGAVAALARAEMAVPDGERVDGIGDGLQMLLGQTHLDDRMSETLALGVLAGLAAPRSRRRTPQDVTTFLMDEDLLVVGAEGESILRLPWFEEELFVGRQLPDVQEIPEKIRSVAVESYRTALAGEPNDYAFTSYGHRYSVDSIPVRDEHDDVQFVLAVATPDRPPGSATAEAPRRAQRLTRSAEAAEQRAAASRAKGHRSAALDASRRAMAARQAAERATANAEQLRQQDAVVAAAPPKLTARELEVLTLASHGHSYAEIAEKLVVTPTTVKTHLAHCYAKLKVPDKAAAVATALRHGLID